MPEESRLPSWSWQYLLFQALAVMGWWIWLLNSDAARVFFFTIEYDKLLTGLVLPDLLIYSIVGTTAAMAIRGKRWFARLALAVLTGGVAYATLFTLMVTAATPNGWVSFGCMLPTLLVTGYLCKLAFSSNQP
jgi:hypothetical protein